jgi:hypothetical protein
MDARIAAVVLVNAGRAEEFHPSQAVLSKLESRHENQIEQIFGIRPAALTANEANYLIGFRTADEIRNRLAKAREETNRRLRSKGIEG